MIRRHVLAALTAGVAAADDDTARAIAARADWILRGRVCRRLEHALIDASLATAVHTDDDPDATRHRLRAAALLVRGTPADLDDRAATAAAFRPAPPAPRWPIATAAVAVLAAVVAAALVAGGLAIARAPRPGPYVRPSPPPAVGAFRDGGAPAADTAIADALATLVRRAAAPGPLADLRATPAFAARGPVLAAAWRALIDDLEAWRALPSDAPAYARRAREVRARAEVVSDQLAAANLGYAVDAALLPDGRRRAGVYAYRIDEVEHVRAGEQRVRVLGMRSIGRALDAVTVLGMTLEELDDPIVLLDQVEDKVARQILPLLDGAVFPLGDGGWSRTGRGREVAGAVTAAIRRELWTALGPDLGAEGDRARAAGRCRQLVAASVRRHEAQHALDHARALPHPAALAGLAGARSELGLRTRLELSAYLSQLAADIWLPQLALWNLARHAFRDAPSASEEAYVGVLVIEALARRFAIPSPGPVIHRGGIDRDRLAALAIPLAARSSQELRAAAAAVWREMFGRRLPRIVDERP